MFSDLWVSTGDFIMIMVAAFLAGFLDSIAGGGGLITLPAYTLTGLPMHYVYGCNKFSASFGTTVASIRYWKHKMLDIPVGICAAIGAFIASGIAAKIVLYLDDATLKTMLLIILPIAGVVTLMNKNMGIEDLSDTLSRNKKLVFGTLIGLAMGFYDGIFGPGTGTFALMAFCFIMKYDLRTASGNAKCLNLASNYAALVVFFIEGTVYLPLAIPAAVFGILGNYIGAGLAIKKGTKIIRVMILVVMVLLFLKVAVDML
ncbi:sulfite exporter TauE/SafE family protein [Chakrabartyella piscis]|uniref:sulfite exporter TauE/SafE family protein n=1 Tax=Chakrabartyella piscis TaxID=2918914 RepID=UPI002958C6BC|nr:TSUP family transporter [Chakrabartyella piscis]